MFGLAEVEMSLLSGKTRCCLLPIQLPGGTHQVGLVLQQEDENRMKHDGIQVKHLNEPSSIPVECL